MGLKHLASRLKTKGAAPTAPPVDPPAGGSDADFYKRRAEAAAREVEAAKAEAARAKAEALQVRKRAELTAALSAAGVINPTHALRLVEDDYDVVDGKVVSRAMPDKDIATAVQTWAQGDGKYMVRPSVPGGGSGAPPVAGGVPGLGAQPLDLRTSDGATAFVRNLTHQALGGPAAQPAAPAQPAAQGVAPAAPPR